MFNGLATASLLLCVATVVLWVNSRNSDDHLLLGAKGRQWEARSDRGILTFSVSRFYVTRLDDPPPYADRKEMGFPSTSMRLHGAIPDRSFDGWWTNRLDEKCPATGFALLHFWQPGDGDLGLMDLFECRAVLIPGWLPACLLALLPALRIIAIVRARRRAWRHVLGYCIRCDYDLIGNVSGVCPECGTPITRPGTRSVPAR
jgi:hypothetical protein